MKVFLATIVVLLISSSSFAQERPHTLTGDIRVHKNFHSKILNNDRDVLVYLPPNYEAQKKERYPVFYLNDGQNLFDGGTSFIPGQEWRADETAEALIKSGQVRPLIIVGIYNTGADRINEYTPVQDAKYKAGGHADLYGRMLVEELKPFIDQAYRTKKSATDTGLGGSSLGGIVSLYLGLKYENVFGNLAVISPSVWFADKQILKFVESARYSAKVHIWLDIGTKEGRNAGDANQSVIDTRLLNGLLVRKGWKQGKELRYFEDEGAEHNERAWAGRFGSILTFLFPARRGAKVQSNTNSYWAKGEFLATALPPDVRCGFAPPFTLRENWRAAQPRVDPLDGSCGGAEPRLTSGGEAGINFLKHESHN